MSKLLKKDVFGRVELDDDVSGAYVLRDTRQASAWVRPIARFLLRRESRALMHLAGIEGVPSLIEDSGTSISRSFLPGRPMQLARPRSPRYFREASALLRRIHAHGVVHNDLAKEPNWLVTDTGHPAVVDFQLASVFKKRSKLRRVLAYEDRRHLLKHKRTYCPETLSAREQRILDSPAWISRAWMATGKKIYLFVTRTMLGWEDREGAGDR